jgi:hypothetical protein
MIIKFNLKYKNLDINFENSMVSYNYGFAVSLFAMTTMSSKFRIQKQTLWI